MRFVVCIFGDGSQVVANRGALDDLFVVSRRINRNIGGVRFDLFFFDTRITLFYIFFGDARIIFNDLFFSNTRIICSDGVFRDTLRFLRSNLWAAYRLNVVFKTILRDTLKVVIYRFSLNALYVGFNIR